MYQNKYPKMIIFIGIYSINRPEAGYGRGGCIYIYIWYPPPVIYLFLGRLRKCLGFRSEVGQSALLYCRFPSV